MKKLISLIILSSFLLVACGGGRDYANPDMPEELRVFHEEQLSEHLAILDEDAENKNSLFEVAYRYEQLGDYNKAIKYYEKVLELDSVHAPTLNNLANIYENMEEYEESAKYIKELYVLNPTSSEVIKDTVRILLLTDDQNNAQMALDNFETQNSGTEELQGIIAALQAEIDAYGKNNNL